MKENQKIPRNSKNQGFTLIELLVVISIIALLASIIIVSYNSVRADARDVKRNEDIRGIGQALELYYADNNGYFSSPTMIKSSDTEWQATLGTALSKYINIPYPPPSPATYQYYLVSAPSTLIRSGTSTSCVYLQDGYYLSSHNEKLKSSGLTYTDGGIDNTSFENIGGTYSILASGQAPCP